MNIFKYSYKYIFLLFLCLPFTDVLLAEQQKLISSLHTTKNSITIKANPTFKEQYLLEDFFIEYFDPAIAIHDMNYSIITLPFILNVISIVWLSGQTYYVDEMDSQLYYSLQKIRRVFQILYPGTQWNGTLEAHRLVDNPFPLATSDDTHAALLFSYGLDSLYSSFKTKHKKQLLLTAYGHFDTPLLNKDIWHNLSKKIINYAQTHAYDYQFFKSNYHNFINKSYLDKVSKEIWNWRLQAVEGLGWAGLVAPILIHTGYSQLLVSASFTWDFGYAYAATPLIDDNLQFAGITVKHDGFDASRVEKCLYLANQCKLLGIPQLKMRVCGKDVKCKNCNKCGKCLRTIIGFLLADVPLKDFGFPISNKKACSRIKKYLQSMKWMHDYVKWIWVDAQQIARQKKPCASNARVNKFLEWFKNYNLQGMPIHPKYSVIQWAKLSSYHPDIPEHLIALNLAKNIVEKEAQ